MPAPATWPAPALGWRPSPTRIRQPAWPLWPSNSSPPASRQRRLAPSPPPPPTRTPTPTPGAPFTLAEQERVCDASLPGPLLQVIVLDAAGQPVPGVAGIVIWGEGQDHFFHRLQPAA